MVAGKINRDGDVWRCSWFGRLEVPPSVNNLVNAKLRRFDEEALEVFKHAAVIGDEFEFDTLAEVMEIDEDDLDDILREGVKGWMIKEQQSALGDFYRFQHSMLRRALYNSMAKSNRRRIHARVAEALEHLHGAKKDRFVVQIAYHYYWAGEWSRALEPTVKAGEIARKREAFNEAITYFRYGAESIEQLQTGAVKIDSQLEGKLRTGLTETLILLGRLDEAESEIARIFELASRDRDVLLRAWGEFLASRLHHSRGAFKRAAELAQLGLESISETESKTGEPELHRKLLQQLAFTLWMCGELDAAVEPLEKAVALAEETGDNRPGGWALSWLGIVNCYRGNGTLGLELGEKGLRLLRASSDRVSELLAWERVGVICGMLGDGDRAIYSFEKGIELARTIGYKLQQSRFLVNLGEANRLKGNYEQAEQHYRNALSIARQIEQQDVEALCMQNLGLVAVARGQYIEAVELLERALDLFRAQNRQNLEAEVHWALGRAKEGLGDKDGAFNSYEISLSLCRKLSYLDYEWRALWGQGTIYAATDRREDARRVISEAIAIIEQLRKQLPEGANLKVFQEDKQPVYDLMAVL
jgi:predicted ATPase